MYLDKNSSLAAPEEGNSISNVCMCSRFNHQLAAAFNKLSLYHGDIKASNQGIAKFPFLFFIGLLACVNVLHPGNHHLFQFLPV
jgi:hypothetical protein